MAQQPDLPPPALIYVDDSGPGITRRRAKQGWVYFDPNGRRITDESAIFRLNRIGLPPAYVDCWYCPDPNGHLQAVGYDARRRKQYRYHAAYREAQEAWKFDRCLDFGEALPRLRRRVEADLAGGRPTRETVIAAVVRLLDLGRVRVGNEAYRKSNKSYGATTLLTRHVRVTAGRVKLEYRGKSGKMHRVTVADRRLARVVKHCQDLPGQTLFQFVDEDGARHPVSSGGVNAYIRDATGGDFTAKHFRTWGASVIAYDAIRRAGRKGITLSALLADVSSALGNTPAIARKSYVHPMLIEFAKAGQGLTGIPLPRATRYLSKAERGLIAFLRAAEEASNANRN